MAPANGKWHERSGAESGKIITRFDYQICINRCSGAANSRRNKRSNEADANNFGRARSFGQLKSENATRHNENNASKQASGRSVDEYLICGKSENFGASEYSRETLQSHITLGLMTCANAHRISFRAEFIINAFPVRQPGGVIRCSSFGRTQGKNKNAPPTPDELYALKGMGLFCCTTSFRPVGGFFSADDKHAHLAEQFSPLRMQCASFEHEYPISHYARTP